MERNKRIYSKMRLSIVPMMVIALFVFESTTQAQRKQFFIPSDNSSFEQDIFNDVSLTTYDLVSSSLNFSEKNSVQKLVFSPFKLRNLVDHTNDYTNYKLKLRLLRPLLNELKLNMAQRKGITTFGIGTAFNNSFPFYYRGYHTWNTIVLPTATTISKTDSDFINFSRDLAVDSYQLTFGYNIQLFEVLAGDKVDVDQDGLEDNKYAVKGHDLGIGFSHNPSEKFGWSLGYHFTKKRGSAAEQTDANKEKLLKYHGVSLSFSGMITSLTSDPSQESEYQESLFWRSIWAGLSIEHQSCTDNNFCENNLKRNTVVTPFLHFKISPKTQFKLGIPIRKFKMIQDSSGNEDEQTNIGPFLQLRVQLAKAG